MAPLQPFTRTVEPPVKDAQQFTVEVKILLHEGDGITDYLEVRALVKATKKLLECCEFLDEALLIKVSNFTLSIDFYTDVHRKRTTRDKQKLFRTQMLSSPR